jgi:hypothetical protein
MTEKGTPPLPDPVGANLGLIKPFIARISNEHSLPRVRGRAIRHLPFGIFGIRQLAFVPSLVTSAATTEGLSTPAPTPPPAPPAQRLPESCLPSRLAP